MFETVEKQVEDVLAVQTKCHPVFNEKLMFQTRENKSLRKEKKISENGNYFNGHKGFGVLL